MLSLTLCLWVGVLVSVNSEDVSVTRTADECAVVDDAWRFDCFPQGQATQDDCLKRSCCWRDPENPLPPSSSGLLVPQCYYPLNYTSYLVTTAKKTPTGGQFGAYLVLNSPYPRDVVNLVTDIIYLSSSTLRIRIRDDDNSRWEPPLTPPDSGKASTFHPPVFASALPYSVSVPVSGQPFGFKVSRSTGEILMQTTGGFIYSDQMLQLSSALPTPLLYGLGEHRQSLMVNSSWTRLTLWNQDHRPEENTNLYGSHPFYLCKDKKGWHGVFLHNSNAMDVIIQPAPAITWRTIGGILDFYIFIGPGIQDVISQYTALVGRTLMPPYWGLGFQLCNQLYGTASNTLATMDRMQYYGIPQDVQWNDIDYGEGFRIYVTAKTFGDQAGLAQEIHNRGMHYIIMVDCGISNNATKGSYKPYDLGLQMGIFINGTDGQPIEGVVWPGTTVWPDFLNPSSQDYWTKIAKDFHDKVPFDGMWVDMDEIASFSDGSTKGCDPHSNLNEPPYLPAVWPGKLYNRTVCPSAVHQMSSHYNVHNLYGYYDTYRSYNALKAIRQKRPFVISRSTFPGQGQYGGHWSGDNKAAFYDMYKSISALLHYNMYGISMSGSDICGFNDNTTVEICTRWHQLGAFYTFSRNHNAWHLRPQDPASFGAESAASSGKALLTRYSLLPYLYTLFHKSHVYGDTVARAVVFEFPDDPETQNLDTQFLWGPALLISPVLYENERTVTAYIPQGQWYNFYSGELVKAENQYVTFDAPLDVINLHVRGGYVLPLQEPDVTTTLSRQKPFWLLVVLNVNQTAGGQLYFDDGDTIDSYEQGLYTLINFSASGDGMVSAVQHLGYTAEPLTLTNVTVFGLPHRPDSVRLNGVHVPFSYDQNMVLRIPSLTTTFSRAFKITW